jgi:tetratricopeptide (TPR) repeat protein
MKSLYDMISASAADDAEALNQAFREAVKAHHPDLHPDDPDAPLRFRQIIAANALLRDAKQRATNDRIRQLERLQFQLRIECDHLRSKLECQLRSKRIRTTVAVVVVGALASGYGLFAPLPTTTVVSIKQDPAATTDAAVKKDRQTATVIAATKNNENTSTAIAAAKADTVKHDMDNAGEPVAALLMVSTSPADSREPRQKRDDAEVPDAANKPNADASAIKRDDLQVIAGRELAPGPVTNDAGFYRERGIAAYRSGDFLGAIGNFDEAIRLNPDDAQSYNIRGNVWDEVGVSERALADYDEAIRIDPNNPAVFHDRAILWQRKGALDKALLDLDRAILWQRKGALDKALLDLDRAIRFSFADANIYSDRGFVWYQKGHHERAIADFNQAIKLDPNFAAAYINRGLILHSNREFTVAFADSKTIRVDPSIFDVTNRTNLRP